MTEDLSTVRDAAAHAVEPAEAFAEKVFTAALGCMETFSLYLGEQTGWIAALTEGPLSAPELARRTGTAERYALEWLEMQAVYGNLVLHSPSTERRERRFALAPGAAEVLHDRRSLGYLGALPRLLAAVAGQLDRLHTAYRDGGGVSWAQFGDHARTAQADLNRIVVRAGSGSGAGLGARAARDPRPWSSVRRRRVRCRLVQHRPGAGLPRRDGAGDGHRRALGPAGARTPPLLDSVTA